jgi:hypothetical protein
MVKMSTMSSDPATTEKRPRTRKTLVNVPATSSPPLDRVSLDGVDPEARPRQGRAQRLDHLVGRV